MAPEFSFNLYEPGSVFSIQKQLLSTIMVSDIG